MSRPVRFGSFEFNPYGLELRKHGLQIRVPEQSLQILRALLQDPGKVITRTQIQQMLWPDGTVVSFEQSINAAVKRLREALSDPAENGRYIERVPRQGYRFIAPIQPLPPAAQGAPDLPEPELPAAPPPDTPSPHLWRRRVLVVLALTLTVGVMVFLVDRWHQPSPVPKRQSLVIGEVVNDTRDEIFDKTLRQALLAHLIDSPFFKVATEDRVQATLSLMGRTSALLTPKLAREVCQRLGGQAVVTGSIRQIGNRYVIVLEAAGCAEGEQVAAEYAEAHSREDVLASLAGAAANLRRDLGESISSVSVSAPQAEASTPSLDALKAYTMALGEKAGGKDPLPLLERAIGSDPGFATAQLTLAQVHMNRGHHTEAEAAVTKAYANRERASHREQLLIESYYHVLATGDLQEAIEVATLAAQLYPHDPAARRAAFLPAALFGDEETAFRIARRELELAPADGVSYFNMAVLLLNQGRTNEATAILDKAESLAIAYDLFPFARTTAAALDGDLASVAQYARRAAHSRGFRNVVALYVQLAGARGQLAQANSSVTDARVGNANGASALRATLALMQAVFGLDVQAARDAQAAAASNGTRWTLAPSSLALALTGHKDSAEALLGRLRSRYPTDTLLRCVWEPAIRGAIALRAGDPEKAVRLTELPALSGGHVWPVYIRGLAYLQLGRASEAAEQFDVILQNKARLFTATFVYGAAFAYPAAQLGLARALAAQGKPEQSRAEFVRFLNEWDAADAGIPMHVRAKQDYQALMRAIPHS